MRGYIELFILVYTALASMITATIFLLGESRIDAYIALNILTYYMCYAVVRPGIRRGLIIKMYNVLLLVVMGVIISLRLYEVLIP